MFPTDWIEVVRLYKYLGSTKDVVLFFEVAYFVYCVVLLLKEVYLIFKQRLR